MGFYKMKKKILMSEGKKAILKLKISGSGINESSLNFELLTNKGLKMK